MAIAKFEENSVKKRHLNDDRVKPDKDKRHDLQEMLNKTEINR